MTKLTIDWAEVQAEKERLAAMTPQEIYADDIKLKVEILNGAIAAVRRKRPGDKQEIQAITEDTRDRYYFTKQAALFQVFDEYRVLGAYFGEDDKLAQHQDTPAGWTTTLKPPHHPLLFVITYTQGPPSNGHMVFKQVTEAQRIRT